MTSTRQTAVNGARREEEKRENMQRARERGEEERGGRARRAKSSRLIYVIDDLCANKKNFLLNKETQNVIQKLSDIDWHWRESERSRFPPAKIRHFTGSCQMLIKRKLAEE